jgi:ectoine hydroxylase-related dioxygenase (phytanoyl-CoA dioxygenase family)
MKELVVSNDCLHDKQRLRQRMASDGYLFFRRLIDAQRLLDLRAQMMAVLQAAGWIKAGTNPTLGIATEGVQCTEGDLEYSDVYHQVYRLQSFHETGHCREIMETVEKIQGCPMLAQPQKVARLWFPNYTHHTTPTHQDFVHFQGSYDNLTCWSPIGDCPRELGGLAVLKGSHKIATVLDHHFSLGAGSLHLDPAHHNDLSDEWLTTDYEIGDTLIFPALTIHKALPNLTDDRLRISLDNRYQRQTDPIAEHMLQPHLNIFKNFTWEQIYEDWTDDRLQYYWKSLGLQVIPRIMDYLEKGFDEAIKLAQKGDPDAKLHLRRTIERDPESPQAHRAMLVFSKQL